MKKNTGNELKEQQIQDETQSLKGILSVIYMCFRKIHCAITI